MPGVYYLAAVVAGIDCGDHEAVYQYEQRFGMRSTSLLNVIGSTPLLSTPPIAFWLKYSA